MAGAVVDCIGYARWNRAGVGIPFLGCVLLPGK